MADARQTGNRSFAAIIGALVVVVGVVVLVVRSGGGKEPAPAGPPQTTIDIVSDPAGATVVLAGDGGLLGVTPFQVMLPKGEGELPVIVSRDGYKTRRLTVPLFSATGRIDVMMTAIGAEDPPPPKPLPRDWTP